MTQLFGQSARKEDWDPNNLEILTALYVLDSLKGFGPQKFKSVFEHAVSPRELVSNPRLLPIKGKTGEDLARQLLEERDRLLPACKTRAEAQLDSASKHNVVLLSYGDPRYPLNAFQSNNPIPVLYVRGSIGELGRTLTVGCVGSREIREPYSNLQKSFASCACRLDFSIVSGFALGADTIGHKTALHERGGTICVMPCGLDRPFPPENKQLWSDLLDYERGVFVSEFPMGVRASSLNLRKRNKLIVALSRGVLVGQSSATGGAMNAYRFALEQRKSVSTFRHDGTDSTTGNKAIAEDPKSNGAVFPTDCPDLLSYERWLRQLSSLT